MNVYPVFATDVGSDLDSFIQTIVGGLAEFTSANLGKVLIAALGITAGLCIAWFAYRFIKGRVATAMKKGKM